jgi:hypothetical protein
MGFLEQRRRPRLMIAPEIPYAHLGGLVGFQHRGTYIWSLGLLISGFKRNTCWDWKAETRLEHKTNLKGTYREDLKRFGLVTHPSCTCMA